MEVEKSGEKNYMFRDINDFEDSVGYSVNSSFREGWRMARMLMPECVVTDDESGSNQDSL